MTGHNKKYFWLKLDRNFFKRHDIQIVESMPNGKDYVLFYLKLLVESIDHEGMLRFNEMIPYNDSMLATITNTNIDIVRSAIKMFKELKLMEILDDKTLYLKETQKMLGESSSTKRVQQYRERKKQLMLSESTDDKCVYCGNNGEEPDHIIPKTKGGLDDSSNIVLSCRRCNATKHNKDVADFLNDNINKFIDLERVLDNKNISKYTEYENNKFKMKRYRNVTETDFETQLEKEKELDIDKEKEIKTKKAPVIYFENIELNKTFLDFMKMRKSLKNGAMTERAIKMMINKLNGYDIDVAIQMLEQSILNNWKDVYDLKVEHKKLSKTQEKDKRTDDMLTRAMKEGAFDD